MKQSKSFNKSICFLLFAVINFLFSSIAFAQIKPTTEPPEWLKSWDPPSVPVDYRSPGEPHKIIVEQQIETDSVKLRAGIFISKKIIPINTYQYVGRTLYLLTTKDLLQLTLNDSGIMKIRDDMNLIRLRDRFFDTTDTIPDVPQNLKLIPKSEAQLHLVQFVGPVQNNWKKNLQQINGLRIVTYMPENSYLVWTGEQGREALNEWYKLQPYVQWHGQFHPAYKLHPAFDLKFNGDVTATIQLITHEKVSNSITEIKNKASDVLRDTYIVGQYTNLQVQLPANELVNIANLEDVVNVEPFIEPEVGGERQGQILREQLNTAGSQPAGPGYLAWLNGLGFNTTFDFSVDVSDMGIDRGQITAANLHQDFLDAGGNSRVSYVQQVTGTAIDVTAANNNDLWGHGTIDLAIVGGFNNTADIPASGTDFEDADGYQYGLGIAPFVQLGSSRIFNPGWTSPDYTELINAAYSKGARINSNSWGNRGGANGSYDAASQEYDGLVRDARPLSASDNGEQGNQEMNIVFLAGNSGDGGSTLWNMGSTAKNTFVVGASENWNPAGTDGCTIANTGANDARDIIDFSSRGPTTDDRVKPDIMAPGTHIYGAASQDPSYVGTQVCDQYFPTGQTQYAWSSGTSHACPAVAGGAALLRQWFLDHGHPAPSPAMTKAFLMNSTTYLTGTGANDDLPSNNQGMGRMNLGTAFDDTPRLLFDQVKTSYRNGAVDATEIFTVDGQVADNTEPFRITLVWTDAAATPGAGSMLNNDLDLELQVGGNFYRGNDFTNGTSNIGIPADSPDELNNVESVFLAPGATGNFTVTVRPSNINSDGVLPNGTINRQDFALVIYNAEFPSRNPVDIILVLDRSGSMNSNAPGGSDKKINLLKDAVEMFIRTWEPFSIPEDRMGVVYFNSGITKYPNTSTILTPFQANANNLINNVRGITATGCTALGGGILTAMRGFDGTIGHQKHIVVFTNGMQNCSPMVTDVSGAHQILADPSPPCCNSGVADAAGVNIADYNVKAIHTIGTGAQGATWTTLLSNIASETGGTYHFTDEPYEDLEDFFIETLVTTLRVDPVEKVKTVSGTIIKNASSKQESFQINSTVRKATFVLSWQGERRNDALSFSLIAPNGTTIPTGLQTIKTGQFYRIASLDFPLDVHGSRINHSGNWRVMINPQLEASQVSYRVHLIVDDADVRYQFNLPTADYGVGETIPVSFWMQHGNRTITNFSGEEVTATIAKPPIGFGTFMTEHTVSKDVLDKPIDLSGDMFPNLAVKKGYILTQDSTLRKKIEPTIDRIELYDDGEPQHGDMKANDGIYSAIYKNTNRPGYYNIDFTVRGNEPTLGSIYRSESKTFSIGMKNFNFDKSTIEIIRAASKNVFNVNVLLIDDFDNYLGPGHSIEVIIAEPGKKWGFEGRRIKLKDNLDGSYEGSIELTEEEINAGAELIIDVNGTRVTMLQQPKLQRWMASIHGGAAIPTGTYANNYNPGINAFIDIGYQFTSQLSLVGLFGYNGFKSKFSGIDDTYWINLSANLKYRILKKPLNPYLIGGFGYYIPKSGDGSFGANLGIGLDYDISHFLTLEIGADYHSLFNQDMKFTQTHLGVIFRF